MSDKSDNKKDDYIQLMFPREPMEAAFNLLNEFKDKLSLKDMNGALQAMLKSYARALDNSINDDDNNTALYSTCFGMVAFGTAILHTYGFSGVSMFSTEEDKDGITHH